MKVFRNLAYAMVLCVLMSCGDDGATVKVNFINAVAGRAALEESSLRPLIQDLERLVSRDAPTVFGMKLIAAYVTEDIDPADQSNKGTTSMIYLNNECEEDIMHCDISAGTAEDTAPIDKIITTYFDFAQTSAKVNADLNAQARTITAGTYKYARLEFCKFNTGNAKNIKWAAMSVPEREFQRNLCTVNSVEISPPIEAKVGSSITINLSYDYSNSVTKGDGVATPATGDECTDDTKDNTCFTLPTFTPSAS